MKTEEFNLSEETLSRLERSNITIATPVQKKIIPAIMKGRDILAQSETGSGKTLSFAIPIIESLDKKKTGIKALILVPTRELCVQIGGEFVKFANRKIGISTVYGGVSIDKQIFKLRRSHVVIATPGRLLDIMQRKAIKLDELQYLVFDEADRMLDMGFINDIESILKNIPAKRQTMLFSATITKEISGLIKKYLQDPVKVSFESSVKPEYLKQTYYKVTRKQRLNLLADLLKKERDLALIFCNRKRITEELARDLKEFGLRAECLNGDMSQAHRERVTRQFKEKRFSILIATDVASRGLHIEDITHVYNYEIPRDVESYTHRIGRTARAGKKGEAISFVTGGEDERFFKNILFSFKGVITLKYSELAPERKGKSGRETDSGFKRERRSGEVKINFRREGAEKKDDRTGSRDYRERERYEKDGAGRQAKTERYKKDDFGKSREKTGKRMNDEYSRKNGRTKQKTRTADSFEDKYGKRKPGNKDNVREKIYFGEKSGKGKTAGGGNNFEKSLMDEIAKLRELPFTSDEHFKKKSFREFKTTAPSFEEEKKRARKHNDLYYAEPQKKKKNWFDKFRKRK